MTEIIKIVITGSFGYCHVDEAFNDKLSITPDSISYQYIPMVESELNPHRKWRYKTNSPVFKKQFETVTVLMKDVVEKDTDMFCTDIGDIGFNITDYDKTRFKETFWLPADEFKDQFKKIKKMVHSCEYTPVVLMTSEDYEEMEDDENV